MTSQNSESSIQPSFSRDVITLVKGTTISLIITVFASPVITRLYGPEAFGLAALFISITSVIGVVACLRYDAAIVLPKSDVEAANVLGLCMLVVIGVSIVSIPVVFVLQQPLVLFLKAPQLGPFLLLIPPTLLVSGSFLALSSWNTRLKDFNSLSVARVASSFATTGTQLGAGFLGYASGSVLIGANILGQVISAFTLGLTIMRTSWSFFRQNITLAGTREVFKKYINFLKYDAGSELINTLSWQIPIFLLAFFFSTTVVGYFSLGMMVITYPMILIGGAVSQVFFQKAAMAKHEGSLSEIFEDIYAMLVRLSLFPLLLLTFIGRDLFMVLFGSSWGEAGYYIQILSVWGVFLFISSPISSILSIAGKQKIALILSSINLATRFLSLYIGGVLGSAVIAILLFSLSGVAVYGFCGMYYMHLAGVDVKKTLKIIVVHLWMFLPAAVIMALLNIAGVNRYIEIVVAGILLLLYGGYLIRTDAVIGDILVDYKLLKEDSKIFRR
jgi:lipopolysaccharide exporter